jgi:hypothetical protein
MNTLKILRNKWFILGALVLLLLPLAIFISSTYHAQSQGVCQKYGRVLSKEELRKEVLVNIVNFYINEGYSYNSWIGINSPAQETNLLKLVEAAYHSNKSFEENFGLKVLIKGQSIDGVQSESPKEPLMLSIFGKFIMIKPKLEGKFQNITVDQLHEPFILMRYSPSSPHVFVHVSTYINEIAYDDLDTVNHIAALRMKGFFTTLSGYGNHYFYIGRQGRFVFPRKCCDNNNYGSDPQKERQEAYEEAVKYISIFMQKPIPQREDPYPEIAMVSNCGEIKPAQFDGIKTLLDK